MKISVVAGMPRAGTTFLYNVLAQHPELFVPARKELEFFSLNFARGRDWYEGFFRPMRAEAIGFDISPLYFFSSEVPGRIDAYFGAEARVVLILRDPADFAVSFYKNRLATYGNFATFDDFLERYDYKKDGQTLELALRPGFVAECVGRYRAVLGDRLLLCRYESMQKDPLDLLRAIEGFVGVSSHFDTGNFDPSPVNASDQLGNRFINKLAHQKWFADALIRLVPGNLLRALRKRYQSTHRKAELLPKEAEAAMLAGAKERFASDASFVAGLFAEADFVTGTGAVAAGVAPAAAEPSRRS